VREDLSGYQLTPQPACIADLFAELATIFATHPAARGKRLEAGRAPTTGLTTDLSLLLRVLTNMLTNAFEATPDGGEVKLWAEEQGAGIVFHVWNRAPIPPEIALRVFQRHFSTKAEYGRGLGTYAMKLVGERMLGGKVDFQTSAEEGTVFRLRVPTGS
jgi:signal transduction histidine kinase